MKKVLVLGLVLGLACAANAALTVGNVPTQPIKIGDVVKLTIGGDGQTPSPQAPWLVVKGPASINGGTMKYPGSLSAYLDLADAAALVGMTPAEVLAYVGGSDTSFITLAHGAMPVPPLTGVLVDDIMLTGGPGMGMVDLLLMNDDLTTAHSTYRFEVIPEPVTIALLGLGGLFLRRRK